MPQHPREKKNAVSIFAFSLLGTLLALTLLAGFLYLCSISEARLGIASLYAALLGALKTFLQTFFQKFACFLGWKPGLYRFVTCYNVL